MSQPSFSTCESAAYVVVHIRQLTAAGQKLSGGADTPALCGMKVLWDTRIPIPAATCKRCVGLWGLSQLIVAAPGEAPGEVYIPTLGKTFGHRDMEDETRGITKRKKGEAMAKGKGKSKKQEVEEREDGGNNLTHVLQVGLNEEMLELVAKAAALKGVRPSVYARIAVLEAARVELSKGGAA